MQLCFPGASFAWHKKSNGPKIAERSYSAFCIQVSLISQNFKWIILYYSSRHREGEIYSRDRVLVGTADGRIGLLILQGNKTLRVTWLLTSTGSGITSLDTHQLQDGIDILVGRQDGVVEVYTFPDEDVSSILRYHYVSNRGHSFRWIKSH